MVLSDAIICVCVLERRRSKRCCFLSEMCCVVLVEVHRRRAVFVSVNPV